MDTIRRKIEILKILEEELNKQKENLRPIVFAGAKYIEYILDKKDITIYFVMKEYINEMYGDRDPSEEELIKDLKGHYLTNGNFNYFLNTKNIKR